MKIKIIIKKDEEYTLTEKWFKKDWNDIEILFLHYRKEKQKEI